MTDDRKATISIGGQDYDLILTTKATKEIAGRYGGLDSTLGLAPFRSSQLIKLGGRSFA